jgi:hypothetical protein
MKRTLIALVVVFAAATAASGATLSVAADKSSYLVGETVTLTVTADDQGRRRPPQSSEDCCTTAPSWTTAHRLRRSSLANTGKWSLRALNQGDTNANSAASAFQLVIPPGPRSLCADRQQPPRHSIDCDPESLGGWRRERDVGYDETPTRISELLLLRPHQCARHGRSQSCPSLSPAYCWVSACSPSRSGDRVATQRRDRTARRRFAKISEHAQTGRTRSATRRIMGGPAREAPGGYGILPGYFVGTNTLSRARVFATRQRL